MNNFTPGINPVSYGAGIQQPNNSPLLDMLQQLFQQRLHPPAQSFGTNGYQVPHNSNQIGQIRADGTYQPFVT